MNLIRRFVETAKSEADESAFSRALAQQHIIHAVPGAHLVPDLFQSAASSFGSWSFPSKTWYFKETDAIQTDL
jgi:hypothetical protein